MGIQRKPHHSVQELLESQPGRGEAGKPAQPKLPPPLPKSPIRAPQPPPPSRTEQPDPKRRREPKGKEVIETRRPRPSSEEEAHRPTKQQRVSHAPSRGPEMGKVQLPEPQAWLPAPILGGEPLTDDASIRDYNGGIGCHVASVLEETLLLPRTWWSYEDWGGMSSSFKLNGFWEWYVFFLPQSLSFLFIWYNTYFLLLLLLFFKGCLKHL